MSTAPLSVLLLDGSSRAALVSARSLGAEGLRVGAAECSDVRDVPCFSSRWCDLRARLPDRTDPGRYAEGILDLLNALPTRVVIPMHDASIEALRLRRSEVEQKSCLALANSSALDVATDKVRTLTVAQQLGIPVPTGVTVHEFTELSDARRHFAFPVVVKPATSWAAASPRQGRLASQVVITHAELDKAVAKVLEAGTDAVLQQWVSGRREAVMLFNAGNRICASFAQAAYRMYPALGGSSILRESIPLPDDTGGMAQRLVEAIGLDGYSEVEFRRDASGRPLLMEINPRLSASVEVAVRAGVDFPRLIYSWAVGDRLEAADHYRVGVRMRWLGGDLLYLRQTLREQGRPDVPSLRRALSAFLMDTIRPSAYDYLDLRDPLPATAAMMGLARLAVSKRRKTSSVRPLAKVL